MSEPNNRGASPSEAATNEFDPDKRNTIRFHCPQCKKWKRIVKSRAVRARKDGLNLYCGKRCSGLARRKHIPKAVKVERKREYDVEYRNRRRDDLRAEKAAYYQRTKDPEKERKVRKARMPKHVEYCRQPLYREWKHKYDLKYRAKKMFGPFADAALILRDVEIEIDRRMTWVERHQANGTLNKSTARKRQYAIQTGTSYPR